MHAPRDLGSNDGPPYEVVSIELDLAVRGAGHEPVRGVETLDPDGGQTQWNLVEVITAIRDGERFVAPDDGSGVRKVLVPALCPACPFATLRAEPMEPPGPASPSAA